jgi:flavodoxin
MKTLIAYYSYEGHSALIAGELAKLLNADTLRIETEDEKSRSGLAKYVWGGKMVFTKQRPILKPFNLDVDQYDLVVLGAPIWAGNPAPALLGFLDKVRIKGKKTALFLCHLGGQGKAMGKLKSALAGNAIAGEIEFKNIKSEDLPSIAEKLSSWANEISA